MYMIAVSSVFSQQYNTLTTVLLSVICAIPSVIVFRMIGLFYSRRATKVLGLIVTIGAVAICYYFALLGAVVMGQGDANWWALR